MQFSMNMVVTYMNMAQDDDLFNQIPCVDWLNQHTTHGFIIIDQNSSP